MQRNKWEEREWEIDPFVQYTKLVRSTINPCSNRMKWNHMTMLNIEMKTFHEQIVNLVHCTNVYERLFGFPILISLIFRLGYRHRTEYTEQFRAHMKRYEIVKSNGIIKCEADQMCIAHAHKLRVDTLIKCSAFGSILFCIKTHKHGIFVLV